MDLLAALEGSDQFRRDSALGALFHHGKSSFRERLATESLHLVVDGDRLSAHVDDVCPLNLSGRRRSQYAYARVLVHNMRGMVADARRRLRGHHGTQRCNLQCEVVWVDDEIDTEASGHLSEGCSGPAPGGVSGQLSDRCSGPAAGGVPVRLSEVVSAWPSEVVSAWPPGGIAAQPSGQVGGQDRGLWRPAR